MEVEANLGNQIYDFYKNPPQNRAELREWLTSWLSDKNPVEITVGDEKFMVERCFRRSFHMHGVFHSLKTGEYLFVVSENGEVNLDGLERYASYPKMLDGVIENYYRNWNLTD